MRVFGFKWFGQLNPSRILINVLKCFWFWFRICQDIQLFVHSIYSQYMYRSILHILSIWTDLFHVFSAYNKIHSGYSQYSNSEFRLKIYLIPRILHIRTYSFCVFSVYEQTHAVYSQYTHRFIPHIRRMRPNNFECLEWNYFLFSF
jgi:hypothetical protein